MKRSGFTMIELIFVIVIIGILAATALPKFEGVRDRAKINSEVSAMNGLDSAIVAAREGRIDDYGTADVNWYNLPTADINDSTATLAARGSHFKAVNTAKSVLKKIAKKVLNLKIEAYTLLDANGNFSYADGLYYNPVVITGAASSPTTGVNYPTDHAGQDVPGKPDKNDFWVFNPSPVDINITNTVAANINPTVVESGSIALVDVNGTAQIPKTSIRFTGAANNPTYNYPFYNTGL